MRRGYVLAIAGMFGVASLWFVPFEILVPDIDFTFRLRLISLIQPAILTLVAVAAGSVLAPKVGLGAPLIDAALHRGSMASELRRIMPSAALAGLLCALLIVAHTAYVVPEIARSSALGAQLSAFEMPLLTKLFYGGITEEILTRWGMMSLFAWFAWRLSGRPERAADKVFWLAIAGAALVFAFGHLPLLLMVNPDPQTWLIAAILLGNAIPGVLFGWLFWKKGIEAAILAHMLAHLVSTLAV